VSIAYSKSIYLQILFLILAAASITILFTCMHQSKTTQLKAQPNQTTYIQSDEQQNPNNSESMLAEAPASNHTASHNHTHNTVPHSHDQYTQQVLPQQHITALNDSLKNNLSINDVASTTRQDGTVIIHSEDRLQTISVAHINKLGNLVISEYNQPITIDLNKGQQ